MNTDPTTTATSPKLVWLSGEFVAESEARVSAFDRGFLYGDGLFETMRVRRGRIPLWERHVARLEDGLTLLGFESRPEGAELSQAAVGLLRQNQVDEGVLRLQVTRGSGKRGYSSRGTGRPTVLISTHFLSPASGESADPPEWRMVTASIRVWSGSPLNRVKSTSKALHVLARSEADDRGADEALLLNERGELVEASGANLFWMTDDSLVTPPTATGALAGITRAEIMRLARERELEVVESVALPEVLLEARGVFLTNSVGGPVTVKELDGRPLAVSGWVARLRAAWLSSLTGEA